MFGVRAGMFPVLGGQVEFLLGVGFIRRLSGNEEKAEDEHDGVK